jgi:hypothetical protein
MNSAAMHHPRLQKIQLVLSFFLGSFEHQAIRYRPHHCPQSHGVVILYLAVGPVWSQFHLDKTRSHESKALDLEILLVQSWYI